VAGSVLIIVLLFALLAGRTEYRIETQVAEEGRWCAFASTIQAIKDNWILGTGFGTFQDVFPSYRNSDCAGIFGIWDKAHNFFLEGYLGLGLPFAAAVVIGYGVLIGAFIRGIRTRRRYRSIPTMGLSALVLVSLHSLVDFSLQIPGVGVYFAAVTAAAVSVSLAR
jgi:O-antigen ligase